MMTTIAAVGQTLIDIALVLTGDADMAYDIAKENGMNVSDMPTPGVEITYSGNAVNKQVFDYYASHGINPATGVTDKEETAFKIFDYTFDFTFE